MCGGRLKIGTVDGQEPVKVMTCGHSWDLVRI